jgi:hypothetical protein
MKIEKTIFCITITVIVTFNAFDQDITQVVRGKVVDAETQVALPFATVTIVTMDPPVGTISDADGNFRIENVQVGRHNIQISYVGYETKVIPEILISSGKEVVLNIGLKEKISQMDEVVVKAYTKKDKPLNSMSTLSARTFSVEEARRYAGGFDDPARLASSFAGVATGYLEDNGIIVRGNAPKGLLWRLEGVEISNPNHFAGMTTIGGGGVSSLSSLMLANSDFFTGAFPAEYANAISGVFDIKLRTGNNEKHEHAIQIGAMGIDISSEGPFSKSHRASYLFNYRYSTFGIIKYILPAESRVPIYQDLCFKINLPTHKGGIFSLWALGADDKMKFEAEEDTTKWKTSSDQETRDTKMRMGAIGLNHRYIFGNKTYLNSSIAVSGNYMLFEQGLVDFDLNQYQTDYIDYLNYKYTFTSVLNHKFGPGHTNRTGIIINSLHYNSELKYAPDAGSSLITAVNDAGSSELYNIFSQSKINLTTGLLLNIGIHSQYFSLNNEFIIEPRIGLTYNLSKAQSLSLGYGKHSRLETQSIYFAKVMSGTGLTQPNEQLKITKAHHFVMAYDFSLNPDLRLKIEPYIQLLYDVPVITDSSYSAINMESDWFFKDEFNNEGTGKNIGIDLTLERFLKDGFYYLLTASLFESKYAGGDKIERHTRYNSNYVVNFLFGKEWALGASKNKILGVNAKLNLLGGQRMTPIDRDLSNSQREVIFDNSRPFEDQKPDIYQLDMTLNYRINKKNHASIWSVQIMNLLGRKEYYGYEYSYEKNEVVEFAPVVIVPNFSYKIEF